VFFGGLLAVFGVWYATEQTLSIHTITTTRRELYCWSAVMATFALGTAARADFIAFGKDLGGLSLGFLYPGMAFMLVIGVLVAYPQASQRQNAPHK
jgi:uncharacterized membrane-anchored protein